jgi:hypothetical protein
LQQLALLRVPTTSVAAHYILFGFSLGHSYYHFSDLLTDDDLFLELAKISTLGPVESFFEKICCGKTEEEELALDTKCQDIVYRMVDTFTEGISNKKEEGLRSRSGHVLKLLINENETGTCALILVLSDILEDCFRRGVTKALESTTTQVPPQVASSYFNAKREVNSFVGYAIGKIRKSVIRQLHREEKKTLYGCSTGQDVFCIVTHWKTPTT